MTRSPTIGPTIPIGMEGVLRECDAVSSDVAHLCETDTHIVASVPYPNWIMLELFANGASVGYACVEELSPETMYRQLTSMRENPEVIAPTGRGRCLRVSSSRGSRSPAPRGALEILSRRRMDSIGNTSDE